MLIEAINRLFGRMSRSEFEDRLLAIVAREGSVEIGKLARLIDPKTEPLARTYLACDGLVEEGQLRHVRTGRFRTLRRKGVERQVEVLAVAIDGGGKRSRRASETAEGASMPSGVAWA